MPKWMHQKIWCPGPESNRHGMLSRGILSPLRLPVSPPGLWRLRPESNRRTRLCRPLHNHSATQPEILSKKKRRDGRLIVERETRFELATPTLARLCSTTELFPPSHCERDSRANRPLCQQLKSTFFNKCGPSQHQVNNHRPNC